MYKRQLLAPVLPFATEETWRWWNDTSVHRAAWPTLAELGDAPVASGTYSAVNDVIEALRREKSTAKVSQRRAVSDLTVAAPADFLAQVRQGEPDLIDAGAIVAISYVEADGLSVSVTLAPEAEA